MSGCRVKPEEVREWVGDDVCAYGIRRQKRGAFCRKLGDLAYFSPGFPLLTEVGKRKTPKSPLERDFGG